MCAILYLALVEFFKMDVMKTTDIYLFIYLFISIVMIPDSTW